MSEDTIQYLMLDRCDPTCNMARYYVLAIEPSLFGEATLIREWGRIGFQGRERLSCTKTQSKAQWRLLKHGSRESGDAAMSSEMDRRMAVTDAGGVRHPESAEVEGAEG